MKNDSKLSMACWRGGGVEPGTCMRIFVVPLISWAPGYLGSRDKGKDTADVNKMPYQGVSSGSAFFIHFVLFSAGCEKVKSRLAGLGSRIPEFWILFCSKWGATEGFPSRMLSLAWQKEPFMMRCLFSLALFSTLARELSWPNPVHWMSQHFSYCCIFANIILSCIAIPSPFAWLMPAQKPLGSESLSPSLRLGLVPLSLPQAHFCKGISNTLL